MQDTNRNFTVELRNYSNEELAALFQSTHDEVYVEVLIAKNGGVVYAIASSYTIPYYDLDDLISEGYVAIWKAAAHYDASKGATFTSYLKGCFKQALNRLYNEAHRIKRNNGASCDSWERLEEINKEDFYTDDHTDLVVKDFLDCLTGKTKEIASFLLSGYANGDIAKAVGCTPATVSYHFDRIRKAYVNYCGEAV